MSNHSPGPWYYSELEAEDGSWFKWSVYHNGPLCYGGDTGDGPENSEANARLIAAAPRMLYALEVVAEFLQAKGKDLPPGYGLSKNDIFMLETAEEAIQVAKGE